MEEYVEYLRNEFKKYKIFKQVSSYDGKMTYHYKLHINGLIKHHFEFKTVVTRKELEQAFIDSYIKEFLY